MTQASSPALESAAEARANTGIEESSMFPVSFAQERLWLLDLLEPRNCVYNISIPARLRGHLDVAALRRTLNEIVRRHEPLRTTFQEVDEKPVQVIAREAHLEVPLLDLCDLPETAREAEMLRRLQADARQPFDLKQDLMLRAELLHMGPEEHILLVTMHHIASDGWSIGVFYHELQVLHEAFAKGQSSPLAELAIQYADFGVWQREWLQGPTLQRQLDYWKRQLAGAPALLELPLDHPRPASQTYRGAWQEFSLDKKVLEPFKALCRAEGCTLFMGLLAAFESVVFRHTGQSDVVVGSPIANRNRTEIEGLIGCFVNTLVLRTDLSGEPTFRELLQRVRKVTLEAYAHQDLPFEKLVMDLQPVRDQSYSPLFQVMFILQNTPQPAPKTEALTVSPFGVENGTTKFDLTLYFYEEAEKLSCTVEYASDLFEPGTIRRLLGHLENFIAGAIAQPEVQISLLPLLTLAEREQLLVSWNETQKEYPQGECLHGLIEAQAARAPESTAMIFQGESLSYRQLNSRANRVARHLRSLGVGPEVLVGLCAERSLEMVIGLVGILKAGGAYVPLDPTYPKERLAFILEDTQASVLLTQQRLAPGLPSHRAQLIFLDAPIPESEDQNPISGATSHNLAYIIYTSGSTGKPKGVAIEHRNAVTLSHWAHEVFSAEELSGVLASTSICFDLSVFELFVTLSWGGQVILAENALQLPRLPAAQQVTLINTVPSAAAELLRQNGIPASVRIINLAGEPLKTALVQQLYQQPGIRQVNDLYGPSEDTTYSTWALRRADGPATIGRPLANTQIYLLDAHRQPVPVGVTGEIYIGGDGVARGYLNRPELTAEKFIPNPFRSQPGARLYKTGDVARYLPDGNIEFLGRMDHQVKIRGFRIELGEIEAVLRKHPNVQDLVVMAREGQEGDKRLVAYVVARPAPAPTAGELRDFLKEKLPEYMIPSVFMLLEALPLTANGKLDRKALPLPEAARSEKVFVAARDPLELQLAQIWEKIFGVAPISIRDNFFDLGGHSLLAVRLFAQVDKLTGKSLPLVTLFQAPTIEQLAGILRQQGWEAPWSSLVPIKANGSKPPFYCVHGVGGNILEYLDLAKYMEADQPFYGLQAAGLDGKRPWHKSVQEMAAHYIQEIRAFQPRGPYYIGGSSFGGLVAFEMAHQLHAAGERIALLALFDTYAPGFPKFLPNTSVWRMKFNHTRLRVELHWGNFAAARGRAKWDYVRVKAKKYGFSVIWRIKRTKRKLKEKLENILLPKAIKDVKKSGYQAAGIYVPGKYPGRGTLFRATGQMKGIFSDPLLGWDELIQGGLDIYDTPGHHGAIVRDPRARVLAEQLKDSLHKAQAAVAASRAHASTSKVENISPAATAKHSSVTADYATTR